MHGEILNNSDGDEQSAHEYEVNAFCKLVGNGYQSVADFVQLWRNLGMGRLKQLSKHARNIFMEFVSSVPSGAIFNKSGKPFRNGRCRLKK